MRIFGLGPTEIAIIGVIIIFKVLPFVLAAVLVWALVSRTSRRGAPAAPAGWYPDPGKTHELRYWDGASWTEHTSDSGEVTRDKL